MVISGRNFQKKSTIFHVFLWYSNQENENFCWKNDAKNLPDSKRSQKAEKIENQSVCNSMNEDMLLPEKLGC